MNYFRPGNATSISRITQIGWWTERIGCLAIAAGFVLPLLSGCTSITVTPTCPSELRVGDSGALQANERNPGAIATYLWQVIPSSAGMVESPSSRNTTLEALEEGELVVRLTASDGLYQMIADCTVLVAGVAEVEISLTANPSPGETGQTVTLVCQSTGAVQAVAHTIGQLDGPNVELTTLADGVASFLTDQAGERTFLCFAEGPDGMITDPVFTTVVIETSGNDNGNDNGGRIPPRGGSRG